MVRKNMVHTLNSKEAAAFHYVCTVFPHDGTPTLPTTANLCEFLIEVLEGDKNATSFSYAPRVKLGPPVNAIITLPRSFYASDVCRRVLDLVVLPHVRVHVVGSSATSPPTLSYLRVYVCQQALRQEIREWGTLIDTPKWNAILCARDASVVVESLNAESSYLKPMTVAARICDAETRFSQAELIEGPSLAPCFGPMQWGPTPTIWGKEFEEPIAKQYVGGVFRTPRIEVASVRMLVEGIVGAQTRVGADVRRSLLGSTKLATRATLLVLDAELVAILCHGCVQQPLAPHTLIDCGPDGDFGPFAPLRAEDVTQCGVIIVADKAFLRHAASEANHVELFGYALARANSQRQGAVQSRADKARALVARLAAGSMTQWALPLSMYQWQRVIVSQKCCNSVLDVLQRERWALVEDEGCAEPGAGMSLSVAKTAARLQGLPSPSFESASLFGHLQQRSVVLCESAGEGSGAGRWACAITRPHDNERQTQAFIVKRVQESNMIPGNKLLPLHHLRLAFGVYPCALEYDKAVACTAGARAEHLLDILEVHVPSPAIEFTRAQLRRIASEAVGDCCVCMSEAATIITFCGHLFCEGCVDMLIQGSGSSDPQEHEDGIKCSVCRATNYLDDFWKLRLDGPLLRPLPAMLQELVELATADNNPEAAAPADASRQMPLLVAVPSACVAMSVAEQMSDGILQKRGGNIEPSGPLVTAVADVESLRDLIVSCSSPTSANSMEAFVVDAATLTAAFARHGGRSGHHYRIALVGVDMPCERVNADNAMNPDVVQTWDSAICGLVETLDAAQCLYSFTVVACGGENGQSSAASAAQEFVHRMQKMTAGGKSADKEPRRKFVLRSDTRRG
jgi:hypothetical protein